MLQFNCSDIVSEFAACEANLTSYDVITKIRSSFNSYLVDAVYALAHTLDTMQRFCAMHGVRATGSCLSVQPIRSI